MFMMMMKILAMVLLVMPRYVCFLALNLHILFFDDVYNIDDDIGDGASGNARQQDLFLGKKPTNLGIIIIYFISSSY